MKVQLCIHGSTVFKTQVKIKFDQVAVRHDITKKFVM